jgi:hypothetical protein
MFGVALPVGDLIEVGYFTSPASFSALDTAAQNLAAGGFTMFGSGAIGDAFIPAVDGYAGEQNNVGTWGFQHNQIYLVAFNATTAGAATQMGVWSLDLASNIAWRFPADLDNPNLTTVDLADVGSADGSPDVALAAGGHIWLGTPGALGGSDSSGGFALEQIVPEPSTYALILMGLFGTIAMIRRRRS